MHEHEDNPMPPDAISLINAICDERATDEDRQRLAEMLHNDPALRSHYIDTLTMDAMLRFEQAAELSSPMPGEIRPAKRLRRTEIEAEAPSRWRLSGTQMSIAAALILGLAAAIGIYSSIGRVDPIATPAKTVAILLTSQGAMWDVQDPPMPGSDMHVGRYRLNDGIAQVHFLDGTEMRVEAPAVFDLLSESRAALHSGSIVARVAPGHTGFQIDAPSVSVVDLGTEFGVSVGANGLSRVYVFEGVVEARVPQPADATAPPLRVRLSRMQAKAFDQATGLIQDIPFDAVPFADVVSATAASGDLIDLTTAPKDAINFTGKKLINVPMQDGQHGWPTGAVVMHNGRTLQLAGNAWKAIPIKYKFTPNTMLDFEFRSDRVGELVGIGFSNKSELDTISPPVFLVQFREHIKNFIEEYANYDGIDWQHYSIPVGKHMTGTMNFMIFVADDDTTGRCSAYYRDVRLYEADEKAAPKSNETEKTATPPAKENAE